MLGLRVELLTAFSGHSIALPAWFAFIATITWLVTIPNIINLVDGIDGLAGGLGILASLTLAIVSLAAGQTEAGALSLLFAAALLGFLVFNFPPARIYMGDGGAYLIGAFLSTISLQSSQKGSVAAILLVVMIALGLPILDTTLAILRRGIRGLPLFRGDARHVHHRLLARGYSKRAVVSVLYGVSLTLCSAGLVVFWTQGLALPIVLAVLFLGGIALGRSLGIKPTWPALRRQVAEAARSRTQLRRSHRMGEFLLEEIPHCSSGPEFWDLFEASAMRLGFAVEGRLKVRTDTFSQVRVQTEGNPLLQLSFPSNLKSAKNWWGLADCLYPAFAAGCHRWGPPKPPTAGNPRLRPQSQDDKIVALHA